MKRNDIALHIGVASGCLSSRDALRLRDAFQRTPGPLETDARMSRQLGARRTEWWRQSTEISRLHCLECDHAEPFREVETDSEGNIRCASCRHGRFSLEPQGTEIPPVEMWSGKAERSPDADRYPACEDRDGTSDDSTDRHERTGPSLRKPTDPRLYRLTVSHSAEQVHGVPVRRTTIETGAPSVRAAVYERVHAIVALSHPWLGRVRDLMESLDAITIDEEIPPGDPLAAVIAVDSPGPALAERWIGSLRDAVEAIHRAGLVHGDVSLDRVRVSRYGPILDPLAGLLPTGTQADDLAALERLIGQIRSSARPHSDSDRSQPAAAS